MGSSLTNEALDLPASQVEEERLDEIDERLIELSTLFEVSRTLNSSVNLKAILDHLLLAPMGRMMVSRGLVLLHEEKNTFVVETIKGLSKDWLARRIQMENLPERAATLRERRQESWARVFENEDLALVLPIRSASKTVGVIVLGPKITGQGYSPNELEFLASLSNLAATSIENTLIFRELHAVNRKLDRKIQELNTLFEIGKELNSTLDVNKILSTLSYAVMGEMMVQRCLILMKGQAGLELKISKGVRDPEKQLNCLRDPTFLKPLEQLTAPVLLQKDESLPPGFEDFKRCGVTAIVPLRTQQETKGLLAIGQRITAAPFTEEELAFLSTLAGQAMISFENARLFQEALEKQRLEEELAIAREIQKGLFPKALPQLEGFEVAALNLPSRQVGGDYYDCINIDGRHYQLGIADVSGKGMPASLLMANLQAALRALTMENLSLHELVFRVNNLIHLSTRSDKFITAFFGVLDVEDRRFTSVNAGHNPPLLLRADGSLQTLEKGGLLLGMMANVTYEEETIPLQSGDWVVMYTDGVSEAMNPEGEEFGAVRIEALIRQNAHRTAQEMVGAIAEAVSKFSGLDSQADDITLLAVKVKANCST